MTVVTVGCGGVREQFLGPRVQEQCDGEWPLCGTTVGCFVGDRTYVESRFPGKNRLGVRLFEPSKVTIAFLLSDIAGTGEKTTIRWYETGCQARVSKDITGRTLVGEAEKAGFVERSAELTNAGDHLLEWESDARLKYAVKVDVLPLRLAGEPGSQ